MSKWEDCQFKEGNQKGHYESYFLRANHPQKPEAFWIRYTLFSPRNDVDNTIGEIWAIYFNASNTEQPIVAVQENIPMANCRFGDHGVNLRLDKNVLKQGKLNGSASHQNDLIEWDLEYSATQSPVLLLPEYMYHRSLPRAKALVTRPDACFSGRLSINGETIPIEEWHGSENHNWGERHTDQYAWGQVAGFDNDPNVFLECSTARVKLGPFWSPWMTLAVLVIGDERHYFNSPYQALKARASYHYFNWTFRTQNATHELMVQMRAPGEHFVGLEYKNPPGGSHTCLNSKIAQCEVQLSPLQNKEQSSYYFTRNKAAFEILTDDKCHNVLVRNAMP